MKVPKIENKYFVSQSPVIIHYSLCYIEENLNSGQWTAFYDEGETITYDYNSNDWKYVRNNYIQNLFSNINNKTYSEFIKMLENKNIYPI